MNQTLPDGIDVLTAQQQIQRESAPANPMSRFSQVSCIGEPQPKTWDDYERGCLATYSGGYEGAEREAFLHGMSTVFNLLRAEFPPAEECKANGHDSAQQLPSASESTPNSAPALLQPESATDVLCNEINALLRPHVPNELRRVKLTKQLLIVVANWVQASPYFGGPVQCGEQRDGER